MSVVSSKPKPHSPTLLLFLGDVHFNRNTKYRALAGVAGAEDNDAVVAQ